MKRDMELIRKILLAAEDSPHGFGPINIKFDGYDTETVGYHMHLMLEAGLINGTPTTVMASKSPCAAISGLTWKGHEFAEAARDQSRWEKAMGIVREKGGSITMDVLKDLLTSLMKAAIGLGRTTGPTATG